jgi:hypothetical protein
MHAEGIAERVGPHQIVASHPRPDRHGEFVGSFSSRAVEDNAKAVENADRQF